MRLPEQVKRLGIVLGAIVALVLLLRFVVLPESLFSAKPHQAAAVVREMAKPIRPAGVAACRECHEEQYQEKYGGAHRNIGCENCHGPSALHAADKNAALPPRPREREACLACHAYPRHEQAYRGVRRPGEPGERRRSRAPRRAGAPADRHQAPGGRASLRRRGGAAGGRRRGGLRHPDPPGRRAERHVRPAPDGRAPAGGRPPGPLRLVRGGLRGRTGLLVRAGHVVRDERAGVLGGGDDLEPGGDDLVDQLQRRQQPHHGAGGPQGRQGRRPGGEGRGRDHGEDEDDRGEDLVPLRASGHEGGDFVFVRGAGGAPAGR